MRVNSTPVVDMEAVWTEPSREKWTGSLVCSLGTEKSEFVNLGNRGIPREGISDGQNVIAAQRQFARNRRQNIPGQHKKRKKVGERTYLLVVHASDALMGEAC